MAYQVPVGAVCELRLFGVLHSQVVMITSHYDFGPVAGQDGATQLDSFTQQVESAIYNPLKAHLSQELGQLFLQAQLIHPTRFVASNRIPLSRVGSVAGVSEPSGVAIVVKRTTDLSGRKFRGRVYLPGVPESASLLSVLTSTYLTASTTDFANWVAFPITIQVPAPTQVFPIVFNLKDPTRKTRITQGFVDPALRYQRRREVGRGV